MLAAMTGMAHASGVDFPAHQRPGRFAANGHDSLWTVEVQQRLHGFPATG